MNAPLKIMMGLIMLAAWSGPAPAEDPFAGQRAAELERIDAQMEQLWQEKICISKSVTAEDVQACKRKYSGGRMVDRLLLRKIALPVRTMVAEGEKP